MLFTVRVVSLPSTFWMLCVGTFVLSSCVGTLSEVCSSLIVVMNETMFVPMPSFDDDLARRLSYVHPCVVCV